MRKTETNTQITNSSYSIRIFNSSNAKKIPKKKIKNVIIKTLNYKEIKDAIINVIIINDDYMKQLNQKYLNHNYPTDVITFEFEHDPLEGEIYISYETACKQAKEYDVTLTNELCRLTVHGTLHLLGFNDNTEENKKIMFQLQEKLIQE